METSTKKTLKRNNLSAKILLPLLMLLLLSLQSFAQSSTSRSVPTDVLNFGGEIISINNTLFVNSSNSKVGIGLSNPSSQLEVLGGSLYQGTILVDSTSGYSSYGWKRAGVLQWSAYTHSANEGLYFANSTGSDKLSLLQNGNFGIGTTTPAKKLVVIGSVNISDSLNVSGTIQAGAFIGDGSGLSGIAASTSSPWNSSGTDVYINDSTASVGIGTSSPTAKLHVFTNANANTLTLRASTNTNYVLTILNGGGSGKGINISTGAINTQDAIPLHIEDGSQSNLFSIYGDGSLALDSSVFYYNGSTNKLGIGTSNPTEAISVVGNFSTTASTYLSTSSGNVGIGTLNPAQKFNVLGTANISASGLPSPSIFVNSLGRVGIGTSIPTDTLEVAGNIRLNFSNSGTDDTGIYITNSHTNGFGGSYNIRVTTGASGTYTASRLFSENTGAQGGFLALSTADSSQALQTRMYLGDSGFVGINTTTPLGTFHVNNANTDFIVTPTGRVGVGQISPNVTFGVSGNANITGAISFPSLANCDTIDTNGAGQLTCGSDSSGIAAGSAINVTNLNASGTVLFSNGRVGIGTTTPNDALALVGTSSFPEFGITINNTGTRGAQIRLVNSNPDGHDYALLSGGTSNSFGAGGFGIFDWTDNAYRFVIMPNGSVGINISKPTSQTFTVIGTLNVTGSGSGAGNLFVAGNGNVGIGTPAPTSKLHVIGSANITGNLFLGGNFTDLAEYIHASDDSGPGDLVVIGDDMKVRKSYKPYDKEAVGVISTAPAATFGFEKGNVQLAISGRVPVKATDENGKIERGDLLTSSSTEGHAMRCADITLCFGKVVGKALTPMNESEGMVEMIIMLN